MKISASTEQKEQKLLLLINMKISTNNNKIFNNYMQIAIDVAKKQNIHLAKKQQEIPVGCLIVEDKTKKILAKSCNKTISKCNPLYHAEIICLHKAMRKLNTNRLTGCSMYVTMEPCCMCSGAIVLSKISNVYIGCLSEKTGCAVSNYNYFHSSVANSKTNVFYPIMEEACKKLIKEFFK